MPDKATITADLKNKAWILLGFLCLFSAEVYGQIQAIADSLDLVYVTGNFEEKDQLKILKGLAENHVDPEKRLVYSEKLIQTAQELDSTEYVYSGLLQKGNALKAKGDLSEALRIYIEAVEQAIDEKSYENEGAAYITMADVYSDMGNHNNAAKYYKNAIDIIRKENDSILLATVLYNAGDEYLNLKKYDSAKIFFDESALIFRNINNERGTAYIKGNMGVIYAEQGNYLQAKENINEAIAILENEKDYPPISEFLITLTNIYADQNDLSTAFEYARRSLEIAQRYGLKKQISETNLKLSQLYEQDGNLPESFKYYKDYIIYKDSINNIQAIQQMADMRTNFEIEKKQDEIVVLEKEAIISDLQSKRQKTVSYISVGGFVLVFFLAIGLYRRYKYIKKTNVIIQTETDRSEKLLHNILPEETALELKQNGKVAAKKFDSVSVMFTDFKEFTRFSGNLSPEELVKSVDFYFSKFDTI
ncbi:MAG: tetratricopeptide repeat protein, partial [Flavobacteriaceae bacterium]|nr:tetratricopeptide repeat protein [Flavobacteriaceae bacterium]